MGNPWLEHLSKFRKANPEMSFKKAMVAAKDTYVKVGAVEKKKATPSAKKKRQSNGAKKTKKKQKQSAAAAKKKSGGRRKSAAKHKRSKSKRSISKA